MPATKPNPEAAAVALAHVFATVDREYETGTVTRLRLINNGGRSKLCVQPIEGRHRPGMCWSINRQIQAVLDDAVATWARAQYGARRLWPVHMLLERPADKPAPAAEPPAADRPRFNVGDYVSWDLRDGAVTVEVMVADRFHITYRASDDVWDSAEATVFSTLAERTAHWRPATDEEIAKFKAQFRPAPMNWN